MKSTRRSGRSGRSRQLFGISSLLAVVILIAISYGVVSLIAGANTMAADNDAKYGIKGQEKKLYDTVAAQTLGIDSDIDFKWSNSNPGVHTLSAHANDEYPVYYYRGNINNNYVYFAGYCWSVIRTTDTGGIKMIYDGKANDRQCGVNSYISTSSYSIIVPGGSTSSYSSSRYSASLIGYMYGEQPLTTNINLTSKPYVYGNDVEWDGERYHLVDTITATTQTRYSTSSPYYFGSYNIIDGNHHYTCATTANTCTDVYYVADLQNMGTVYKLSNGDKLADLKAKMFKNEHDSAVKTVVDNWYVENLASYSGQIEDTVYCNDRTYYDGTLVSENTSGKTAGLDGIRYGYSHFGSFGRKKEWRPSVDCPQLNDSFTVSEEKGNGKLTYPIALITLDEALLAGSNISGGNYLKPYYGSTYQNRAWTMSPHDGTSVFMIGHNNGYHETVYEHNVPTGNYAVRPVISLSNDNVVYCGNGLANTPWVVNPDDCETVKIKDPDMYKALRDKNDDNLGYAYYDDETQEITLFAIDSVSKLDLSDSGLVDISDLTVFPKLEYLDLSHNHIKDMSPIKDHHFLGLPDLSDNNIENGEIMVNICRNLVGIEYMDGWSYYVEAVCDPDNVGNIEESIKHSIINQKLEDYYKEKEYPTPGTLKYVRQSIENIISNGTYGDYSIDDFAKITNASLSDDGETILIDDDLKEVEVKYYMPFEVYYADWESMDDEEKAELIAENGGKDYYPVASLVLHPLKSQNTVVEKVENLPVVPNTNDNYAVLAAVMAVSMAGVAVALTIVRKSL